MAAEHGYEEADVSAVEACYRREHDNGEQTVVTVRSVAEKFVVEAVDIDDKGNYPSEQVDVTRTREEAVRVAEEWLADHEKGVKPGGLASFGLGGD